jgi:hypothetical protein
MTSLTTVSVLVSFGAPLLVALITKQTASPALKAVLLLAVSAAVAAGNAYTQGGLDQATVVSIIEAFGVGVLAHFGLWKPLNAPAVLAPAVGLGKAPAPVKGNPRDPFDGGPIAATGY